mgnify:FL=1
MPNLNYKMKHVKLFEQFVNEGISVSDERHFGKKGIIIMIDDNGKKVSAIFKDKKNADKFNRNNPSDIKKLLDLAKKTKYPKAIDESVNERRIKKYHLEELQDDYGYEAEMDGGIIYVTGENPWNDKKEYTFSWDGEYAYCGTDISDSTYSEPVTSAEEFSMAIDDTDNWE